MPSKTKNRRPRRRLPAAEVERQAYATKARPLHVLPESFHDAEVQERMGDWIKEHVPLRERPSFIYGRRTA